MADKQISELTEATSLGSNDLFVLQQSGIAKKITPERMSGTFQNVYVGDTTPTNSNVTIWLDTSED